MIFSGLSNKNLFFFISCKFLNFIRFNLFFFIYNLRIKNLELEVQLFPCCVYPVLSFITKNNYSQFKTLLDIVVYDIPKNNYRFVVVYSVLSKLYNKRLFISTRTSELFPLISVGSIYRVAN